MGGRAAPEFQLDDQRMVYAGGLARLSRQRRERCHPRQRGCQRRPWIAGQLQALQQFDEEYLVNYELGFKGSLLADRLQARLAVFYMDGDDQQVKGSLVIPRPDGSTAFIDYTSNAAQGHNYGSELELTARRDDLLLFANIGLLQTEFEQSTSMPMATTCQGGTRRRHPLPACRRRTL